MPVKIKSQIIDFYGLQTPFRCGLFGSSRVGKTTMIFNLLKYGMFDTEIKMIYYCFPSIYENKLDWHNQLDYNFEYMDFLPTEDFFHDIEENSILILDDCWFQCTQNNVIRDLFKVLSGKKNINVFITSQNPFEGGSHARTLRNNLNYFFLFRNLGDQQINKRLSQQLGFLTQYEMAMKTQKNAAYRNVLLNLDVRLTNEKLRVLTDLFEWPIATT